MDKMLTLGIVLSAKDAFSHVFGSLGGTLKGITKDIGAFSTAMTKIGTVSQGAFTMTRGFAETAIKSFVDLEEAQTQLKNTLMKSDGSVSPFFKSISDEATKLGNKLPGTTADFYAMASTLKSLGVGESTIVGGALKSAAYLGVVLKSKGVTYEEAATATAKFKEAFNVADDDLISFIDDIQRMSHTGLALTDMSYAFSKVGATMKGIGKTGITAAKEVSPLIAILGKTYTGETVGTGLSTMIKNSIAIGNKEIGGIKFNFMDENGKFAGMENMVRQIEKVKKLSSDSERQSVLKKLFGEGEQLGMAMVLMDGGIEKIERTKKELAAQADIIKRADEASKTLGSIWEAMTGTATNLYGILGGSLKPEMAALTNWFNNATSAVSDFAKEHPQVTKFVGVAVFGFVGLTAVVGTLGIAVGALAFGFNAMKIGAIVTTAATWGLAAANWALNTALLNNPIVRVAGILLMAGTLLYNRWKPFSDLVDKIGSAVAEFFGYSPASKQTKSASKSTTKSTKQIQSTNQRVASARNAVAAKSAGATNNTVNVTITNPNFTSKEHAAATQKQIDEQVRKAMQKQANDKKDRSYT